MSAPIAGGVPLTEVLPALRRIEPSARACWIYDLDAVAARAARLQRAFAPLDALVAYALKANGLPAILEQIREAGLGAEAGSVGELERARAAGYAASQRVLNGNGRTPEEAEWAAREGVALVNADSLEELEVLECAAAAAGASLRVALRVNPGIETPGHRYIATGDDEAKFGMAPADALAGWAARDRWPHLRVDGLHLHIGSQLDAGSVGRALEVALELVDESGRRGAPLSLVNLGGGFGVDSARAADFPLEEWGRQLEVRTRGRVLAWVFEPGRWIVAPAGWLLAEVLSVKRRASRTFVVLAAGMNDLIRPALYHAVHPISPLEPRPGKPHAVTVVGPVCESADVFAEELELQPLERGDVIAIGDAGAYGAAMSSNYNGRPRLAELVAAGGKLRRARAGETAHDLDRLRCDDALPREPGSVDRAANRR